MTEPIDFDFPEMKMPFSCTTTAQVGANILQIAPEHRNRVGVGASTIFEVPDGVSSVLVSWDGPQSVEVGLRHPDGSRKTIERIPAGQGSRTTSALIGVVGVGHGIQVFLDTIPTAADANFTGTINVTPFMTPAEAGGI